MIMSSSPPLAWDPWEFWELNLLCQNTHLNIRLATPGSSTKATNVSSLQPPTEPSFRDQSIKSVSVAGSDAAPPADHSEEQYADHNRLLEHFQHPGCSNGASEKTPGKKYVKKSEYLSKVIVVSICVEENGKVTSMANETIVQSSIFQENPDINECRENIPPGVAAAAETSKLQDQVDVIGYSPQRPSGENEPLSETCTSSTPAPASSSSSGGAKTKSRISGLQSALTPILKYLNIGNKRQSPEPLKCGNNPSVPPFSFGVSTANCQKSTAGSSEHPNSDFSCNHSGRSLGNKDAPVRWLDDEYLPEITLLDVTCDSTMQMTRNDSALPDVMPGSLNGTCSTLPPSQLSSSVNIVNSLQSNVSGPNAESGAEDPVRADFKSTTKTSLVMKQNHPCDVQDVTFHNDSVQRSSGNTILGDSSALAFHHQNNTLDSKSSCKKNGTLTLSESSDNRQNTMDKPSPPKVCIALTSTEGNNSAIHLPKLSKHNGRTAGTDPSSKMVETPERTGGPLRWLDDRYFPEITLLDVTRDSELSPEAEISAMEVTQDIPPVDSVEHSRPLSKLSGLIVAEPDGRDMIQSEELSTTLTSSVIHSPSSFTEQSKSEGGNLKTSLEAAIDDSLGGDLKNNISSSELSGQNTMSQISVEYTLGIHPTNVTRDISSSSDVSVQCVSQLSTSDVQSNTSLKNVTSELHVKPVETKIEELLASHDAELKGEAQQMSPKTAASINNTFNVTQAANLSASMSLNSTNQISCPQNMTLDLPPTEVNSPKAESLATDPVSADFKDTTDTCLVMDNTNSAAKASGPCEVQNATFDRHFLQKSGGSTTSGEAGATTFCLQNNTFDSKPADKQNGTITLSETSSSDSHQNSLDKPSPSNVCNLTDIHKVNTSEVHLSEESKQNGTTTRTDPETEMTDSAENTFEANPAVEAALGARRRETKDHSQSVTDDAMGHQGKDTENNNANTFNLDDTLDLKVDSLVTSTPMTHCKVFQFNTEHHEGKTLGAQKKLYGDGPSRPVAQVSSDVPSNIVPDRKTFLAQPTAKSLLPPLKTASQLMKYKPTSTLPGRCEPSTSGLPMTRQRTQAEALKSAAPSDATQGTTGISSSYNLRATTTGSKHPNSGLLRPLLSGIPSGIQRTATGLRPPSARSNAPASSSDKLRGPTATNPVTKTLQLKKHPLTRGEPLPTAKRKKLDTPLPSSSADASISSCDAVNRAKHLKQPGTVQRALPAKAQRDDAAVPASTAETSTSCNAASRARVLKPPANGHRAQPAKPQSHGCAKCVALGEQLKVKSEEIRRLKEELLKYSKQGEEF